MKNRTPTSLHVVSSLIVILSFFLVTGSVAQEDGETLSGRDIMEEQKDRHSANSEIEQQVMLLVDGDGNRQKRMLKRYSFDVGDDLFKYLLVFQKPNDVRGTSLLTWQHDDQPDDQWLYLPAFGKQLKRIAQGSKSSYFMGTDYTYEDLSPENLDKYNYRRIEDGTYKGTETYKIEATPVEDNDETGYSKRIMWVRKDIFFTVKVKYFDMDGSHIKTQSVLSLNNIQDEMYRARKSVMDNMSRNHKTLILIQDQNINIPIDENIFTERSVLNQTALNRNDLD